MLSTLTKINWCRLAVKKQNFERKMCTKSKKPFTILVEGNIGSGKTTFINNFANNKNILTLLEPLDEWKNLGGHDLMTLFYADINKWAFTFQSYVLLTMMQAHQRETNQPVKMIERSIYSGRYVFIENLYQMNVLSRPELVILDEWFNWLTQKETVSVDLIVYLRTDPEVAYQRILKRSREGENKFTLDYVKKLHDCHEKWLFGNNTLTCPAPVWCLDANKDKESVKHEYEYYENQMKL